MNTLDLSEQTWNDAGDDPVLELIGRRHEQCSRPGERGDDAKLALVIEGGGMRGVVAGGMVTGLEKLGLRNVFDFVIGSSAGAFAGAYFLAGGAEMGTRMYFEDLIGRQWLAYHRLLKRSPILAFDYLFDELIAESNPLEYRGVQQSGIGFYAVATRLPDYERTLLGDFRSDAELHAALRASAFIPLIAGKCASLRGVEYIDGSLTEGIPVESARRLGATHMLVLLTRPRGQLRSEPSRLQRRLAFPLMNRVQDGLGDACSQRAPRYRRELGQLEELRAATIDGPAAFALQLPSEAQTIGLLAQDRALLEEGARAGEAVVTEALGGLRPRPVAELVH
jgi:predicted patatin/cPLA2 family phospholipase